MRCTTYEKLDELLDRIGNLNGVKQTQTSIILNRKIDRRVRRGSPRHACQDCRLRYSTLPLIAVATSSNVMAPLVT